MKARERFSFSVCTSSSFVVDFSALEYLIIRYYLVEDPEGSKYSRFNGSLVVERIEIVITLHP
jgi:hypothetical protein